MSLWTSEEIKLATDGKVIGEWVVDGISIDTRNLVKGDLFIALKDKRDGHDFVKKAFECGAVAALVSHIPSGLSGDSNIVLVPDVLQALQNMARFSRKRFQGKLIAITGSVGKTSTKEMLKTVLNYQGETHASEKSFNNHWGVPLTLARMPSKTEYAILELGMNKSGEIRQHSLLSKPHVALITSVNMVHMSSFKNLGEIALAKSEIFDGLVENGTAIVNSDIEPLEIVKKTFADCNGLLVTFGKDVADWKLNSIKTNDHSISVFATQNQNDFNFELISLGEHFALNSLAVLAVVNSLKLDLATAITDFKSWKPLTGRADVSIVNLNDDDPNSYFSLIDDSYNSNPTSLKAGIVLLNNLYESKALKERGNKIVILGDMLELGEEEETIHQEIAKWPELKGVRHFYLVGSLMKNLYDILPNHINKMWFESSTELSSKMIKQVNNNDIVLVKGSKKSRMSEIVTMLKNISVSD